MKRTLIFIVMALFMSLLSSAEVFKAPAKQSVEFTDTTTIHQYEIKDKIYPIYKTKSGKYYIWKTSAKTGKQYKYYLPKQVQEQINENQQLIDKMNSNK